jgi:hypothetical protein
MIQRWFWGTLYGLAFMMISGTMLFSTLDHWPDALLWLKLGVGLAAQFGLGIFAYMQDPEGAWKRMPSIVKGGMVVVLSLGLTACGVSKKVEVPSDPMAVACLQRILQVAGSGPATEEQKSYVAAVCGKEVTP